jgi:SAM-dependent methyltransferase
VPPVRTAAQRDRETLGARGNTQVRPLWSASVTSAEPGRSALTPGQRAERASSFGSVADDYGRYRPGPSAEAVAWALPGHLGRVVDLGAGTGGLTRRLVGRAAEVVAVEPDERMRQVLTGSLPGVRAVAGRGESIPLARGCAEAVLASASWHWMDLVPTLHEVGRVLVPGGVLGVMWSGPDLSSFVEQTRHLLGDLRLALDEAGAAELTAALRNPHGAEQVLVIPPGVPFDQPETKVFAWDVALTADQLIGLLGTYSWVILMGEADRRRLFDTARLLLRDALGVEGDATFDLAYRTEVWRARRHR